MAKVHVLVEGQTEEEFIRDVLGVYLKHHGVYLNPIVAKTKRAIGSSPAHKGGIVSYGKIEFDVKNLLNDSSVALVTTMIDYYRLPTDFPGSKDGEAATGDLYSRITHLETKFAQAINHRKFLPYLSVHEFEALLFTEPDIIVRETRGEDEQAQQILRRIRDQYDTPEEINLEDPPSKHIMACIAEYNKVAYGSLIAVEIGIEKMQDRCPHFHEWVVKLSRLGDGD